jgi:hypothetical protein
MQIMSHPAVARMASQDGDAGRYQRHRPEQTLLYQIVDEYYTAFGPTRCPKVGRHRLVGSQGCLTDETENQ